MTETTTPEPSRTAPADAQARGRLPYDPPRLVTFGTVQALTQAQGGLGSDNAGQTPNGSNP